MGIAPVNAGASAYRFQPPILTSHMADNPSARVCKAGLEKLMNSYSTPSAEEITTKGEASSANKHYVPGFVYTAKAKLAEFGTGNMVNGFM